MSELNSSVPGITEHPNLVYHYIESKSAASFRKSFFNIAKTAGPPWPSSGGIMGEEVELELPTGISLFCVSAKGDLSGHAKMIERYCDKKQLKHGFVRGTRLLMSDGSEIEISSCRYTQHIVPVESKHA